MWEAIGGRTPVELDRADPVYRRWVLREAKAGRFVGYLVEDGRGTALGSGAVWLAPMQPRPGRLARKAMPYILSMYTEPSGRGRGVASTIVTEILRWARARGYPRVTLHASQSGRPVYAKLGFVPGNEMRLDFPRRERPAARRRSGARPTGRSRSSNRIG